MFYTRQTAEQHSKWHSKSTVPCPHATEPLDAPKSSLRLRVHRSMESFHVHFRTLDEKRVHCPLSEEYTCETLFFTVNDARKHSKSHCDRYPCPEADTCHCTETFSRQNYAFKRVKMAHGSLWLCTVPLCYRTIARFPHTKRSIEIHEDPQRTWGFGRPEGSGHTNRHLRNHGLA
jgi:hypothetical protein